jgi:hypothetical protein
VAQENGNHEASVQLSIIEYVKQAINTEREFTKQKLKRINDRIAAIEGARTVASETLKEQKIKDDLEYQRRLGELNHEKERLAKAQGESVSRELFDARNKVIDDWRSGIDKTLSNYAGRILMIGGVLTFLYFAVKLFWK